MCVFLRMVDVLELVMITVSSVCGGIGKGYKLSMTKVFRSAYRPCKFCSESCPFFMRACSCIFAFDDFVVIFWWLLWLWLLCV